MDKQNNKDKKSFFKKIGTSFSRKGFRSGLYAAFTSVLVIVAVVVVNLIVSASGVRKDLTIDGQKSLTESTKELLSGVEDDLTFYFLTKEGETLAWLDPSFEMYMDLYEEECDKIQIETIDLLLNPKFPEQYTDQTIIQYSIIVVNEATGLSKYVSSEDMVLTETTIDQNTFQYVNNVVGLDIEGQVNAAIRYVLSGEQTKLYAITGHGEWTLESEGQNLLRKANIDYNTLETMTATKIPEDCDILFVANPAKDYTDTELQMMKDYADRGGKFLILGAKQEGLENYDRLLAYCGSRVENAVILEGDAKYHNPNSQRELYPILQNDNDIIRTISGRYVPMYTAFALKLAQDTEHEFKTSGMLMTSKESYAKNVKNNQIISTKEDTDEVGPFVVGMYLENQDTGSEAVVLSSGYVFADAYLMISNFGNAGLLINTINALTDSEAVEAVRTISFTTQEMLTINAAQANLVAVVMVISIPVLLIVFGIFVMLRRRSR